jgi:hypothetical protein
MMDERLKELIQRSRFHVKPVLEVVPLLPETDEGLDAWVEEAVRASDAEAFQYVVCAALIAGRPVDSRHLRRGLGMFQDGKLMLVVVWRMTGEVAEHLVEAVHETSMTRERNVEALLIAALWSKKHREGKLPEGLINKARMQARELGSDHLAAGLLRGLAEITGDENLKTVLEQKAPLTKQGVGSEVFGQMAEIYEKLCSAEVRDMLPQAPPQVIACGMQVRRSVERIGRNDPCPCGSGQKYKRCCHDKDQERLRFSSDVAGKTVAEVKAEQELHLNLAKLKALATHELARLDVLKISVKNEMRETFIAELSARRLVDEAVTAFEHIGCHGDSQQMLWDWVMRYVTDKGRKDLAERMMELRYSHGPLPWSPRPGALLLLRRDDPVAFLEMLEMLFKQALEDPEKTEEAWLCELAYAVMISPLPALGILLAQRLIPIISKRAGVQMVDHILKTRDRMGLSPQEPFADLLEKRFSEEVADEGKDARELRIARQKLEAKAAENRQQIEELRRRERELRLLEKKQAEKARPVEAEADAAEVRELREKLHEQQSTIRLSNAERAQLRRELGQAYAELKAGRKEQEKAPAAREHLSGEEELLLPGEVESAQPPRLIEFPRRFQDTMLHLPRQVVRTALTLCGRLAAGDPSAFSGVVRLKAAPDVLRVRVGLDHRMLFRLLPDTLEIVDLINRRDLEKRIRSL